MGLFGSSKRPKPELRWVRVTDIETDNDLRPPQDPHYMELLEKAVRGEVFVYYAGVPLCLCVPFDQDFRPDLTETGKKVLPAVLEEGRNNRLHPMWVYQRGWWFVVSDDYLVLWAATYGMPDLVPCMVLGKPDHPLLKTVQGPIDTDAVRKLLLGQQEHG